MKKVLVLILALVLCISAFAVVGCSKKDEEYDLDSATAYVKNLYKKYLDAETPSDFTLVSQFVSDGVTYTITWTTNSDKVKVVEGDKEVTIDVDEKSEEDVSYTLTATIKAPDGTTKTLEFKCKVPKFELNSHDEYIAAASGDTVIVQGVVVAIHSKTVNSEGKNQLYLADLSGEGGYYVYYLTSQDPLELGIKLGMTVQITGQKDIYNGVHEIKEASAEIIDSTIKEVTPVDITETFKNAEDAKADALLNKVGMLVTIKGVEITTQDFSSDAYLKFRLGNIESYVRAKNVPTSVSDDDLASIKKGHSEHKAWLANVTGVVTAYNGAIYLEPVSANAFEYISEITRTDAEKVEVEKNDLTISSTTIKSNSTITLPTAGTTYTDVKITWASDNDAVAITDKGAVVTLGSEQIKVTLTATLTLGETTVTKTIELTLEPAPTLVPTIVENPVAGTAYKLHIYQGTNNSDIYFAGKMSEFYGAVTTNHEDAVDVYLEEIDGGLYMYFMAGSTKTYITAVSETNDNGTFTNFKLVTEKPETPIVIDSEIHAPTIKVGDTTYFFGTYNTYNSISLNKMSKKDTNFIAHLVVIAEAPAGGDNTGDDNNGDDNNGGNTVIAPSVVENPTVGTAYKFFYEHTTNNTNMFFDGTAGDFYGNVTSEANSAVDVYLETATDGYYIYFMNGEAKTYIEAFAKESNGRTYVNLKLTTETPASVWAINETIHAPVVTINEVEYFLGSFGTNTDLRPCNISYAESGNYITRFATIAETPAGGDNTGDDNNGDNTGDDNQGGENNNASHAVLDMMGTTNFTYVSTSETKYSANGIVYTNTKSASTTDNYNQTGIYAARAYAGSNIKIEYTGMKKVVFTLDDYKGNYLAGLDSITISGATITRNNDIVTIEFENAVDSFETGNLGSQIRIEQIEVYTA